MAPLSAHLAIWLILGAFGVGLVIVLSGALDFVRMFGRPLNEMAGARGHVLEWSGDSGYVMVEGERWRARASVGLAPGEEVVVRAREGLVVEVRRRNGRVRRLLKGH
ncbi:MAG: NfeD family protein [Alphaproteobacteria bacterium]|nr:NfeD family protein [Alphaproteobacteria bacterium]